MNRTRDFMLIVLSFIAILIFPLNIYGSVIVGLSTVLISKYLNVDTTYNVDILQNFIFLVFISVIKGAYSLVIIIINTFARLSNSYFGSGFYNFLNKFELILNAVLYLFILVYIIMAIIYFVKNKKLPAIGKLADRIVTPKSKQENKKVQINENDIILEKPEDYDNIDDEEI